MMGVGLYCTVAYKKVSLGARLQSKEYKWLWVKAWSRNQCDFKNTGHCKITLLLIIFAITNDGTPFLVLGLCRTLTRLFWRFSTDLVRSFVSVRNCCWQSLPDRNAQIITGVTVILHENYMNEKGETGDDIAVIRLPRPLTYNDYVQPVCLPSTPVADGTNCVVTGWGATQGAPNR